MDDVGDVGADDVGVAGTSDGDGTGTGEAGVTGAGEACVASAGGVEGRGDVSVAEENRGGAEAHTVSGLLLSSGSWRGGSGDACARGALWATGLGRRVPEQWWRRKSKYLLLSCLKLKGNTVSLNTTCREMIIRRDVRSRQ